MEQRNDNLKLPFEMPHPSEFEQLFDSNPELFRRWKLSLRGFESLLSTVAAYRHKSPLTSLGFCFNNPSIRLGINAYTFSLFLGLEVLRESGAVSLVRKIQSKSGLAE